MTILNQYEILESTTPIWWSIIEIVLIISFVIAFIASISTTNASTVKPLILIFVAFVTIIWSFIVYPIVHKEDVPAIMEELEKEGYMPKLVRTNI